MPELPEVQSLADFLRPRLLGRAVDRVDVAAINVLKTYDPAPSVLRGLTVTGLRRHGKFLDLDVDGLHLIWHLSRAGWLRWYDTAPAGLLRPGKGPNALRVRFTGVVDPSVAGESDLDEDAEPGFDLTEQGTQKRLAVYLVRDPMEVPGISRLGPDPLEQSFDREAFGKLLAGSRTQIKGLLRDQSVIAGVGNAYSDDVLHAAKLSPYAVAGKLSDEQVDGLYEQLKAVLTGAIEASAGKPAKELKDSKRAGMRVHGRTGQPCPVCGDVVREVSFADRSMQYCATCQTGGKVLADRRLSRLLK